MSEDIKELKAEWTKLPRNTKLAFARFCRYKETINGEYKKFMLGYLTAMCDHKLMEHETYMYWVRFIDQLPEHLREYITTLKVS